MESQGTFGRLFTGIPYFESSWHHVDTFKIKDYNPLINPRAHSVGAHKTGQILNQSLKGTYDEFLKYLAWKKVLDCEDMTILISYLLLQDRLDEALDYFSKMKCDTEKLGSLKVQYDYLHAYLSLYNEKGDYTVTKSICMNYLAYPVIFWRNMFVEIANQLSEIDDTDRLSLTTPEDASNLPKDHQISASEEESLEFELNKATLKMSVRNVSSFTIKYFKTDLEVLFSKSPFLSQDSKNFSYVSPYESQVITTTKSAQIQAVTQEIPESLRKFNLYVQVTAGSYSKTLSYFPTNLGVRIQENYGIVKIHDSVTGRPLPKVYVKCFTREHNGSVKFYKDGYTDIRGSFDYARLNVDKLDSIDKFSILVVGDQEQGLVVKQCGKPSTMGKFEEGALLGKRWKDQQQAQMDAMDWETE